MTSNSDQLSAALSDRYRIERELGAGGMATVYLAEDLRHDRKVAIKVLKPELAAVLGGERFVVEIKTTASLQHPHILPLFDSGTAKGFLYYVMPFIEGETIREKLNRETQFGVEEAVRMAREVADALDYAHRRGVIHRDIKPENILLHDGRAMVMDFGIALAVSAAAGGRMTETGLSLGTPHYMSPEQATADKELSGRSDVYSLASVLYEMLAGQPPHLGGSAQQIIMKIIAEPVQPVTRLRRSVPPNVAGALERALEKLPADRFASAKEFSEALRNPAFSASAGTASAEAPLAGRGRATIGLALLAVALAVALGASVLSEPTPAEAPVIRFTLTDDDSIRVESGPTRPFAVSPDGRTIVFRATSGSSGAHLWLRTLSDPAPRPLEGSQDGMNATFSPDGEWVAFITENINIRKVRVSGGTSSLVARAPGRVAALFWSESGEIFFEQIGPSAGIHRVSANGGPTALAVPLDTANGELAQRRPVILGRSDIVAYASSVPEADEPSIVLYRLSDGRRLRTELPGIGAVSFLDDLMVYSRVDGTLMATRIDARRMQVVGAPVPLEPRVATATTGTAVALSSSGTLVYAPAADARGLSLALVDTSGQVRPLGGRFTLQVPPRVSPNGRYVAMRLDAPTASGLSTRTAATYELQVLEVGTGVATRLRTAGNLARVGWTGDSRQLVTSSVSTDSSELLAVPLDGSSERRLARVDAEIAGSAYPSPDGRSYVLGATLRNPAGAAVLRVWVDGSARVDTLLTSRGGVRSFMTRLSPDGKLVTYNERTSGDVYVLAIAGGAALQVSDVPVAFSRPIVWAPDSRRLYYVGVNGLNTIDLETSPELRVVRRSSRRWYPAARFYDLLPDGRTFVMENPLER
ncbi:MAG TPA: protein kinase, partial [Gemmatimonadaceae bacterium]|nr:protein kinase [Gemmatimonadaceae bacterium]